MEWSKALKKKNNKERKSYRDWHMPTKKRKENGWKDKDQLAVRIEFGDGNSHEQSVVLTSGGSFRIDREFAIRLENAAQNNEASDVRFVANQMDSISLLNEDFEKELDRSFRSSAEERRARLAKAAVIPEMRFVLTSVRNRNADVVAQVSIRANGKCEVCNKEAPFKRDNGRPYLEVHHKIWLANNGEDTVNNAIALCPNCHREAHFGKRSEWEKKMKKAFSGIS